MRMGTGNHDGDHQPCRSGEYLVRGKSKKTRWTQANIELRIHGQRSSGFRPNEDMDESSGNMKNALQSRYKKRKSETAD